MANAFQHWFDAWRICVRLLKGSLRDDPARVEVLRDLHASCRSLGRLHEAEAALAVGMARA